MYNEYSFSSMTGSIQVIALLAKPHLTRRLLRALD
jgi:hypothetical protein